MVLKISLPILTFLIAFLGGLSNSFTDWSWYERLEQSSLRPPNYIFGIVWPILYTLMAVVSFLQAKLIYKVYIAQLILNGAWSWIFFAHQALTLALFDIIILIILNVIILHKLWTNNSYVSFFLYLPYVLWISFASYLNANIVFLN